MSFALVRGGARTTVIAALAAAILLAGCALRPVTAELPALRARRVPKRAS